LNGWKYGILALILLGSLPGCLPTQRELSMERDLAEMKRHLADNEKAVAELRQERQGKAQDRLDILARQQADLQAGIDALRVDIQTANGRLDDAAHKRDELQKQLSLVRDDLGVKINALEERVGKLEARPKEQAQAPAPAPAAVNSPQALYQKGLDLIQKQGNYSQGREVLQDFLKRYPKNELAVNAMYWIGESFYGEKKYENAILEFQDVIQKYGDHPKAAAALLKQGMAFQALGDNKNAGIIWHKLIDTFPLSEEAKSAKHRLASLKGAR
jgi:tol-pal system protein YbgF